MTRLPGALAALYLITTLSVAAQPKDGKQIFRFDTFGDEQLWTDTLQMHTVVAKLTPRAALEAGLKVDSEVLPLQPSSLLPMPGAIELSTVE